MLTKVREIITALNASAKDLEPIEAQDLWAILTSLRGPDAMGLTERLAKNDREGAYLLQDEILKCKLATTARIRSVVLPTLAAAAGADVNDYSVTDTNGIGSAAFEARPDVGGHFVGHISQALEAINRRAAV